MDGGADLLIPDVPVLLARTPYDKPTHGPVAGEVYFWPTTDVIAIYYADLGQAVPGPGLIRIGSAHSGLNELVEAGRGTSVHIELVLTRS